jgi:hypothetical protein
VVAAAEHLRRALLLVRGDSYAASNKAGSFQSRNTHQGQSRSLDRSFRGTERANYRPRLLPPPMQPPPMQTPAAADNKLSDDQEEYRASHCRAKLGPLNNEKVTTISPSGPTVRERTAHKGRHCRRRINHQASRLPRWPVSSGRNLHAYPPTHPPTKAHFREKQLQMLRKSRCSSTFCCLRP